MYRIVLGYTVRGGQPHLIAAVKTKTAAQAAVNAAGGQYKLFEYGRFFGAVPMKRRT